jgi:hypothetical protein
MGDRRKTIPSRGTGSSFRHLPGVNSDPNTPRKPADTTRQFLCFRLDTAVPLPRIGKEMEIKQ